MLARKQHENKQWIFKNRLGLMENERAQHEEAPGDLDE